MSEVTLNQFMKSARSQRRGDVADFFYVLAIGVLGVAIIASIYKDFPVIADIIAYGLATFIIIRIMLEVIRVVKETFLAIAAYKEWKSKK